MKSLIKNMLQGFGKLLGSIFYTFPLGDIIYDGIVARAFSRLIKVSYNGIDMKFACPNRLTKLRAKSFSKKEPFTVEWISHFTKNDIFFDVGANIGLYSIYAGLKGCNVYAFEPSILNIELIARNIDINNINNVHICCIPLSDVSGVSSMKLSNSTWGGALTTFMYGIDQDGGKIKSIISYGMLGFSLDDLVRNEYVPQPDYMKIDVDGIEHYILKGGKLTLSRTKEVLIEVNDNFLEQRESIQEIMIHAGFDLVNVSSLGRSYQNNQLWRNINF